MDSLLRCIESGFAGIPKTIKSAYEPAELKNEIWALLAGWKVRKPSRLQVRCAAIDVHRRNTRYRKGRKHGYQFSNIDFIDTATDNGTNGFHIPAPEVSNSHITKALEIAEHFKDIRRRFGTDGLVVFLLTRILSVKSRDVSEIMGYDPDSAMAKAIGKGAIMRE